MSLLNQASKGIVPLQELVVEASKALEKPATLQSIELSREQEAVALVRNIFLLSIGLTYQKYGENIVNEQEALMNLANLAIDLYAIESAVLRTIKTKETSNNQSALFKIKLTAALVTDTLIRVEMNARRLFTSVVSGDHKKIILTNIFERCSELSVEDTVETKRDIADAINLAENYIS